MSTRLTYTLPAGYALYIDFLDFLKLFFDDNLSKYIIDMTNLKLQEYIALYPGKKNAYLTDFSIEELNGFLGLLITTGIFHSSREAIIDLYSEDENKARPI